jgi:hypothetical protein
MLAILGTIIGFLFLMSETGRVLLSLGAMGILYVISTGLPFVILILLLR